MADNKAQKEKQKLKYPQNMKGKQKKMHFKHQTKKDEAKERWKKKVLYDFKKQQRRQRPAAGGVDVQKLYAEMSSSEDEQQSADPSPLPSSAAPRERFQKKKEASRFSRAQRDYQQKAEKKQQKYEEVVKKKHEQEAALQSYREKKKAKFLRMCKKTPRGQPIMKYRIHHLLEQIDQQTQGRVHNHSAASPKAWFSALGYEVGQASAWQVVALDGDGAMLMHMGALSTLGQRAPINFRHIVFNNGAHDSVGGQPTAAGHHDRFSVTGVASACGYREAFSVRTEELSEGMQGLMNQPGPF